MCTRIMHSIILHGCFTSVGVLHTPYPHCVRTTGPSLAVLAQSHGYTRGLYHSISHISKENPKVSQNKDRIVLKNGLIKQDLICALRYIMHIRRCFGIDRNKTKAVRRCRLMKNETNEALKRSRKT